MGEVDALGEGVGVLSHHPHQVLGVNLDAWEEVFEVVLVK